MPMARTQNQLLLLLYLHQHSKFFFLVVRLRVLTNTSCQFNQANNTHILSLTIPDIYPSPGQSDLSSDPLEPSSLNSGYTPRASSLLHLVRIIILSFRPLNPRDLRLS